MSETQTTATAGSTEHRDGDTSIFGARESSVRSYCRQWPVVFTTARGAHQQTETGEEYLDFFAGAGALNYGHNNPAIKGAMMDHLAQDVVIHSMDMHTPAKRHFLEVLTSHVLEPRGMDHKVLMPGPTGTNTVEAALKAVRKATGRSEVVAFTNGFHGMTLGSLSVTANKMKRAGAGVPLTDTQQVAYDSHTPSDGDDLVDLDQLDAQWAAASTEDLPAGAIVELVQGEGGLNAASMEWVKKLADLCAKHDVKLIVDDVQAGCGRTGTFFSFEPAGITPDVVCLSKSLSGLGLPFAITLIRPELDQWTPGEHNGTFRGFTPAFVTAAAAIENYWADDAFGAEVRAKAERLHEGLATIAANASGSAEVRGRGLMCGIAFEDPEAAGKIAAAAFERHLMVETSGPSDEVVKLLPPLTVTDEEIDEALRILTESVAAVGA
ncbi:diaminobutyrate--2-oxoglutarate transaminase [Kytococcus sedentarius]|uniref:Diaminobutyrate--2-oxoglutarate transaminase n=1 Tax=Kytococcus sedentarius (strain ATCC 14392 / DSM 20547 / JCM 11482 / CCUG 33030 / NBRC 15357 / NCTC 11040 / CCM 314 / 541) TaxID=478801 RepID=C7NKC7_KYTSD|nr:diaminobutyrate--2-oxoglutarate transaminase [Kytococcus sedentarius]ACV06965.1 diaminobutyrate aminotransferase [Kytococcus sedentarius DSM 20547]QQB62968.1 diaminobutyrate--2-oxoglutarate transaminase [Kytococcus sedentarius]STX14211.1 Diaminobutyrate--2-oxoglutarate transaminase [Kytococcus sedentarius]